MLHSSAPRRRAADRLTVSDRLHRLDDRALGTEAIWSLPRGDSWQSWRAVTLGWGLLLLAGCLFLVSTFSTHTLLRYLAAAPLLGVPFAAMAHAAQVWDGLALREAARQQALREAAAARAAAVR